MTEQRPVFVFSADELAPARVDEPFLAQAAAFRAAGFVVGVLSPDGTKITGRDLDLVGAVVVFRGWMMTPPQYERFVAVVVAAGATPFVSAAEYRANHHIDGWLEAVKDLTPETVLLPPDADLSTSLSTLGWSGFFLKDFVKSLKTSRGSVAMSVTDAVAIADELLKFRGEIEGGFAVRRVEAFRTQTERRFFVVDGHVFSAHVDDIVPAIVHEVAARLRGRRFFSVDIIERDDDILRVVELGDGQVSDLVGWDVDRFVAVWTSLFRAEAGMAR